MLDGVKKYLPFRKKWERFLVVEILDKVIRATSLRVSFEEKELEFSDSTEAHHALEDYSQVLGLLERTLKKFGKIDKYKVIVGLDSCLATTIHRTVRLARDNPSVPIDGPELNNKIAQGIWKLFDKNRTEAASKMKSGDVDVVLADVNVKGITLDGHKVANPIGFKARALEIQLCQTFNARSFAAALKKLIPSQNLAFVTESGSAISDVLSRAGREDFLLVMILRERGSIFYSEPGSTSYLSSFEWGKINLLDAIEKAFLVSRETAEKILDAYLAQNASPVFLRNIEKILSSELSKLADSISKASESTGAPLRYLLSSFEMPAFVFDSGIRNARGRRLKFKPAYHDAISEHFNFYLKLGENQSGSSVFSALAVFLGFCFLPSDDTINRIAKRHARWLTG